MGDFVLRLGSILLGSFPRGFVLELEYLPGTTINSCTEIMQEFLGNPFFFTFAKDLSIEPLQLDIILGPQEKVVVTPTNYSEIQPPIPDFYSHIHTTHQYLQVFKNILAK